MEEPNNNQTIIIKNQDDDTKGFTWSDYIKQLGKFKYWVLGITLVCLLIGYLFIAFYFSPKRETYTAEATLHMPLLIEKDEEGKTISMTYLNGSSYSMYDIITENNIKKTVNETLNDDGQKKYASLNAENIIKDNAITIALQPSQTDSTVVSDPGDCSYRLTLQASSFPNIDVARSFVDDLLKNTVASAIALVPSNHVSNIVSNETYLTTTNLNNEVDTLSRQYDLILECYSDLLDNFQGSQYSLNGQDFTTIYNQFINTFQSELGYQSIFDDFEIQLDSNSYFRYTNTVEGIEDAILQCGTLANQYASKLTSDHRMLKYYEDRRNSIIDIIKPSSEDVTELNSSMLEMILEWNQQILDLQLEINDLRTAIKALGYNIVEAGQEENYVATAEPYETSSAQQMIEEGKTPGTLQYLNDELSFANQEGTILEQPTWGVDCQEFITKVNSFIPTLSSAVTTVNTIYHNIYQSNLNSIVYNNSSIVVSDGSISGIWGALLGLVVGFIASSLILAGIGYSQDKKKAEQENLKLETNTPEIVSPIEGDIKSINIPVETNGKTDGTIEKDSSTDTKEFKESDHGSLAEGSEDEKSK